MSFHMYEKTPNGAPRCRLCIIKRNIERIGLGFNLHEDKDITEVLFVGLVEPDSPAALGGLKLNDRLLEINSIDVRKESLSTVVCRIMQEPDEISLLVADPDVYEFYKMKKTSFNTLFEIFIERIFGFKLNTDYELSTNVDCVDVAQDNIENSNNVKDKSFTLDVSTSLDLQQNNSPIENVDDVRQRLHENEMRARQLEADYQLTLAAIKRDRVTLEGITPVTNVGRQDSSNCQVFISNDQLSNRKRSVHSTGSSDILRMY